MSAGREQERKPMSCRNELDLFTVPTNHNHPKGAMLCTSLSDARFTWRAPCKGASKCAYCALRMWALSLIFPARLPLVARQVDSDGAGSLLCRFHATLKHEIGSPCILRYLLHDSHGGGWRRAGRPAGQTLVVRSREALPAPNL